MDNDTRKNLYAVSMITIENESLLVERLGTFHNHELYHTAEGKQVVEIDDIYNWGMDWISANKD